MHMNKNYIINPYLYIFNDIAVIYNQKIKTETQVNN